MNLSSNINLNFYFFMQKPNKKLDLYALRISYFLLFLSLLQPFLISPIVIINYSSAEAAFWILISSLVGLTSIADGGVSQTALRFASYFNKGVRIIPRDLRIDRELNNVQNEPNIVGFKKSFFTLNSLNNISLLFSGILIFIVGLNTALGLLDSILFYEQFIFLFCLVFIGTSTGKISFLNANLQGIGRLYEVKILELFFTIFRLTVLVILLLYKSELFIALITWLIINIIYLFTLKKLLNLKERAKWSPKIWVLSKKIILQTLFMNFGSYLCVSGVSLVASNLPAESAVVFLYLQRLFLALLSGSLIYLKIKTHNLSQYMISSDIANLLLLSRKVFLINNLFFLSGFISLLFISFLFYDDLGLGYYPLGLLLLFGVVYFLELQHTIVATIYICMNKNPFLIPSLLSGLAIFVSSLYFGDVYGAYGLILSQGISQLLINNWFPFWKLSKKIDIPIFHLLRKLYI